MSLWKLTAATVGTLVGAFCAAESVASRGNCKSIPNVLLILGCRVKGEEAEDILKSRISASAKYLNENKTVLAICCGGIVHDDQYKSEAQAIKEGLMKSGVEEERIILEDKSTTTLENFINAKEILEKLGKSEDSIAFLSSEFHLLRAGYIAKKAGVKAKTIAATSPKNKVLGAYVREFFVFPAAFWQGGKNK